MNCPKLSKNKTLILLTDSYPYGHGELFLDEEVDILSKNFQILYIYTMATDHRKKRSIPSNVTILVPSQLLLRKKLKYALDAITSLVLWADFFSIKSRFKHSPGWLHLKILLADYINGKHIAHDISCFCKEVTIDPSSTVFYSYWHDAKALALSFLKAERTIKAIARGHGWDIDYCRHSPGYLPFKNYIVFSLTKTISISDFGQRMLEAVTEVNNHYKISKSYLGKKNTRKPLIEKTGNQILICSCSSMIPLKRVDWIIKVIAILKYDLVHWVHFGDGPQRLDLEKLADDYGVSYEFRGNIGNDKILDFYAQNYVDLFINLSSSEGVPVSIMEAQSAGIPVLALDLGGCSEIVNNENGVLLNKEVGFSEISKAIQDYLTSNKEVHNAKRILSYESWKGKFDGTVNFNEFSSMLQDI